MRIIIDLNQHAAIADFTVQSPVSVYDFKSQDTIDWWIYFVRDGIVQDLGAALTLKFGMIQTGDLTETILAYQTVFSHQTDSDGGVYYLGQVNFNTSQMASAIAGKTQLPCTIEIRYQTSNNEIIHSLNVPAVVFPTILVETGVTPPGVDTSYPDASTLVLKPTINQPSGVAGLDTGAKLYLAQFPSAVEMQSNRDQPGGYPSLDSGGLLNPAVVPGLINYADPANGLEYRDDLLSGYGMWFNINTTAGAGAGFNTNPALDARGITLYTLDAVVPSQILFCWGNIDPGFEYCLPIKAGSVLMKSKLGVDTLSDGTNTYTAYWGLMRLQRNTFGTNGSPWAGFYFEYDASHSSNWQACVATGTNKTTNVTRADTGIAVVPGQWINAKIVVNAAWNNFQFFINGVLKATISSGYLPTASDLGVSPVYFQNRTVSGGAGNVRTLYARAFYMLYQFSDD